MPQIEQSKNQKLISVAIIGKPNAGKSSLLNKILNKKLSIVTPKPQTTRSIITGILTVNNTQIILLDTPGLFKPERKIEKSMTRLASSSLQGADIVAFIIDASKDINNDHLKILQQIKNMHIKPIFLLNKIDLTKLHLSSIKKQIMNIYTEESHFFEISATQGKNIDFFINYLTKIAKKSPWLYNKDDFTNLSLKFIAAEITREKLLIELEEELPYRLTVETEKWQNIKNESEIIIHQVIYVPKISHKIIILGKKGSKIKIIGTKAREEIGKLFQKKIHLFLFIKIKNWEDKNNNPELT